MNYLMLIWADGMPTPEQLAVMQRELPAWNQDTTRRGVRVRGRELDLPETAATVRVRGAETLVTDGPFAETKEFIAGFDLLRCVDLDEAIEVATQCPISQFQPLEIRPFADGLPLDEQASAFATDDDPVGSSYLLNSWIGDTPAEPYDNQRALTEHCRSWRRDLKAQGLHVFGNELKSPDTARTVRVRDGETVLSEGPFTQLEQHLAGIDVVSCGDRPQAVELAATHPIARYHTIEVRPFYSE